MLPIQASHTTNSHPRPTRQTNHRAVRTPFPLPNFIKKAGRIKAFKSLMSVATGGEPATVVQVEPPVVVEGVDSAEEPVTATKALPSRRRFWMILAGAILFVAMAYLLYTSLPKSSSEHQHGQGAGFIGTMKRTLGGIFGFDTSGDPVMPSHGDLDTPGIHRHPTQKGGAGGAPPTEDPKELLSLATRLKDAGFVLMGVSSCSWTGLQREIFGDRNSEARKVIESIYTECRGRGMCPGVRSFPTWARGDDHVRGFQPPAKLREIVTMMEQKEPRVMIQEVSEPNEENIPDAKHAVQEKKVLTPEDAKQMAEELFKKMKAEEEAAAKKSASNAAAAAAAGGSTGGDSQSAPTNCKKENEVAEVDRVTDDDAPQNTEFINEAKKEYARGVSAYAPLNVPDMPGTAPFNLEPEHADFQNMQGNVPRAARQNHAPNAELTRQVVRAFETFEADVMERDSQSSAFSATRYPHSVPITTGEGMTSKAVLPAHRQQVEPPLGNAPRGVEVPPPPVPINAVYQPPSLPGPYE